MVIQCVYITNHLKIWLGSHVYCITRLIDRFIIESFNVRKADTRRPLVSHTESYVYNRGLSHATIIISTENERYNFRVFP